MNVSRSSSERQTAPKIKKIDPSLIMSNSQLLHLNTISIFSCNYYKKHPSKPHPSPVVAKEKLCFYKSLRDKAESPRKAGSLVQLPAMAPMKHKDVFPQGSRCCVLEDFKDDVS